MTVNIAKPYAWENDAACAGGDLHFPDHHDPKAIHQALLVCRRCPVTLQCGQLGLDLDVRDGIWGGALMWKRRVMPAPNKPTVASRQRGSDVAYLITLGVTLRDAVYRVAAASGSTPDSVRRAHARHRAAHK